MGSTIDIASAIEALNPSVGQITALFTGLSKIPPNILQVVLQALDDHVLAKLAIWSQVFSTKLNDLGPAAFDPSFIQQSLESGDSDDFFNVMKGTRYVGPTLTASDLDDASNAITGAIKTSNWIDAVQVGLSIAQFIPVVTAAL